VIPLADDLSAVILFRFIGLLMSNIYPHSGGSFKHVLHGYLHGDDQNLYKSIVDRWFKSSVEHHPIFPTKRCNRKGYGVFLFLKER